MIFRHCRGFIRDLKIMRLDIKISRIYYETFSPGGRTRDISGGLGRMRRSRPNEFITRREIRGTRLPVIHVKEKEVSAASARARECACEGEGEGISE